MLQASTLGASIYNDIFIIAFKLPNLFRRIFAEGAFTQSFLPSFASSKQKGIFSVAIFLRFFLFLLLFSILVTIFDNFFTKLIAFGFDQETINKAAPLVAINFYYLLLIFIVTFLATLLQYKNHFATTAFSTALLNISLIFALLYAKDFELHIIVYYMSYAVIVGGIFQILTHVIAIKRLHLDKLLIGGFKHLGKKKQKIKNDKKRFKGTFFASIIGNSTAQISAFLDTWLASFLVSGSISYLYFANRIFQFPLALFAIATSIALFPKIAKFLKNKDYMKAHQMLNRGFWFLLYLLSLATICGIIFSKEIVWLLFERGVFNQIDTINTANVLNMYMIGLLPFGLAKIFSLWLYSTHRQKKAAQISGISLAVNIVLSIVLINILQERGLALASSISGFILLFLTIKEYGVNKFLDIIKNKKILYFIIFITIWTIVFYILKDFINVYI